MDMPELRGEVIYLYAFDVAYELRRDAIHELLGQRVEQFEVEPHKRMPRQLFFHRPQMVRLPIAEHRGSLGAMRLSTTIKLLPVGAITITMRIPFAVDALADLVAYHAPQLDGISLDDHARRLAEQVCAELVPALVRPVASLAHEEASMRSCSGPRTARAGWIASAARSRRCSRRNPIPLPWPTRRSRNRRSVRSATTARICW